MVRKAVWSFSTTHAFTSIFSPTSVEGRADISSKRPLFHLGELVATPGALDAMELAGQSPADFILRHVVGDWGDVCDEDKALNDAAVQDGSRILSAYVTSLGVKVWVITEATDDGGRRAATTILLPEEY